MRINRQRRANKVLKFYSNNFGFRKPYQILLDGTFCNAALESKVNINDQLCKYLNADTKILTTPCAILEIEKLGPALYGAMLILKQFPIHHCGHKNPIFAAKCIKEMIGNNNENRYMIATQDRDLQQFTKHIPGVPVLHIFNKAPILNLPNYSSIQKADQNVHQCSILSKTEKDALKKMKKVVLGNSSIPPRIFKKRKRKGGPNPLSCKKKKIDSNRKNKNVSRNENN